MLARYRQLLATAIFLADGVLVATAWLGAYWLRFRALGLASPLGVPPLPFYLWTGAIVTLAALLVLRTFHVYRSARTARLGDELFALVQGVGIVTALSALGSFFTRGELSRSTLVLFALLASLLLCGSRVAIRYALRQLRRHGRNLRRVLVVGTGEQARSLLRKLREHPDFGLVVEGLVAPEASPAAEVEGIPVLGTVEDLPGLVEQTGTDLVYLALARSEYRAEEEALARLGDSTAAVRLVPDLARVFTLNASVEDFDGMPIVLVTEDRKSVV